jgi:uncharacterized protein YfaP (DUF2135 family)
LWQAEAVVAEALALEVVALEGAGPEVIESSLLKL